MSGVVSAEELSKASAAPAAAVEHVFEPVNVLEANKGRKEIRRIPVPPHRFGQLKRHWVEIFTPIVSSLKLQMRMNTKTNQVEIQTSPLTEDIGALQRAADFVKAFLLGFEVKDALALLRMDELYVDSFDVDDVKRLTGDNLSRAIGRIAGKDGRTRVLIENSTRTRIVLADKFAHPLPSPFHSSCSLSVASSLCFCFVSNRRVHILGSFNSIRVAKDAIVDLIIGSPPGKVASSLRAKSARLSERW